MPRPTALAVAVAVLSWWVLAARHGGGWIAGATAVGLAVLLHLALGGRGGVLISMRGTLRFVPYFLAQSVRGGTDVARRALSPSLPIDPAWFRYRLRLTADAPRVFFINCISLLPGTFSAHFENGELTVHLLADAPEVGERLHELEDRVAGLFGVTLGRWEGPEERSGVGP